jgi:integrase
MNGSFVRKRGKTWTAYYYPPGTTRRQRSKGGFRTKKEAEAYLADQLSNINRGVLVEPTKLTFGDYLTEHWLPLMQHSLRPTTWDSYDRCIRNHVLPKIGGVPLQDLTASHLDRLYTDLLKGGRADGREGGLSPKTVRYIHTTLHKALKDAERKQLVMRNVAQAADAPRVRQDSSKMRTWTGEEVAQFLAGIKDHRLYAAYLLAVSTGMRRGEVLGLHWSDVDLTRRRLAVRRTVTHVNYKIVIGEPKTRRSRRVIALDLTTVQALRDHKKRMKAERLEMGEGFVGQDLVFSRPEGTPIHPDYFSQSFEYAVKRLKLPRIRLHDLRHTHATLGLAAGVPAKVMSDRLGHATVAFTQDVYMHAIPQLEEDAADQIADLIFGTPKNVIEIALTNSEEDETILPMPNGITGFIAG